MTGCGVFAIWQMWSVGLLSKFSSILETLIRHLSIRCTNIELQRSCMANYAALYKKLLNFCLSNTVCHPASLCILIRIFLFAVSFSSTCLLRTRLDIFTEKNIFLFVFCSFTIYHVAVVQQYKILKTTFYRVGFYSSFFLVSG